MLLPLGGLEGRPEVRLGGEGGGDLEEKGGGGEEAQRVGLVHPALLQVVLEGEGPQHGAEGVRVNHRAAHPRW